MLDISKVQIGDQLTVTLAGRLDRATSPQLEGQLNTSLDGIGKLIFDFKDLEYISSAGLRVILKAQKILRKDNSVVIMGASKEVRDVFEITGFSQILTISWI